MNKRIWVLGSSNIDVTYRVKDIPLKGYTVRAKSCITATGGKGANQAVAAAHWGIDVSFIGAVGDDPNGETLLEVLRKRNINVSYVNTVKGVPSGNAVIFVDDKGSNCIIVYPGANQCVPVNLCPDFSEGDILVAQLEVNMDAVGCYFMLARQKKMLTILNPSPYVPLSQELLKNTDIIVANETEAYELGGIPADDPESAKACAAKIISQGPGTVVITLGKLGVVVVKNEEAFYIPEYPVEVVDTQGAGDAFLGTFAAGIAQGNTVEDSALFANMVAALSVTKLGTTQASMPDLKDITDKNPGKYIKF